jgi:tight adherence protein C
MESPLLVIFVLKEIMLILACTIAYLCGFSFVLGLMPVEWEQRPSLQKLGLAPIQKKKKNHFRQVIRKIALVNKPLCQGVIRVRMTKDLSTAHIKITSEEFMLVKEIIVVLVLSILSPQVTADFLVGWIALGLVAGYIMPELWLRARTKKVKEALVRELPDAIDLLGLCVNAGLDFMLSLKWVVEKSKPSIMIEELNTVLQEINIGKTRREAIKDLALKYDVPELSTFARTMIQADKMGTSVTEALTILSEDMRIARFRRGEQIALKAPLKLLVPLLLFIFPVVGILVAGPIMLDFVENNPFANVAGGAPKK